MPEVLKPRNMEKMQEYKGNTGVDIVCNCEL